MKQGFLFGLGFLAAIFVVALGFGVLGSIPTQERDAASREPLFTPSLPGLRGVVLKKGFECIDSASNSLTHVSENVWRLQCPVESYLISLSADGEVVDVRRVRR